MTKVEKKPTAGQEILRGLSNALSYARTGQGAVRVHRVEAPDDAKTVERESDAARD